MKEEPARGHLLPKQDRNRHHYQGYLLREFKIPFRMRKWIDVEPGDYDRHSFEVSKKMIRLLRHDRSVHFEKKTEQLNSKFWHRWLHHNSRFLRTGQFEHGWVFCKEEVAQRRDFSIAWILTLPRLFKTFEQFKAILEEIKLIQHCKTTCCYRATSPSTSTTLEAPTTCTPLSGLDWFRVGKDVKKGRQTVFFTALNHMFAHLRSGITTRRNPEYQFTKKLENTSE